MRWVRVLALSVTALTALGLVLARSASRTANQKASERLALLQGQVHSSPQTLAAACERYERSKLLTGALAVDCSGAHWEARDGGLWKLSGATIATRVDQFYLGGGHAPAVCIGRRDGDWEVLGTAHQLADCTLGLDAGPEQADALAAAKAEALLEQLGKANRGVSEHCPSEFIVDYRVSLVDARVLDGTVESSPFNAAMVSHCSGPALAHSPCRNTHPQRHWLMLDPTVWVDPVARQDSYTPGKIRGRLILLSADGRALCSRDWTVDLDRELVLGSVQAAWTEEIAQSLREGADSLGHFELDPYWTQ